MLPGSVSDPHWFQWGFGSGSSILGHADPGPDPDPGVWYKELKIITAEKNLYIFLLLKMQFTYPKGHHKGRPSYNSHQKRTSSTWKHEISSLFSIFMGLFGPLNPDPDPTDQYQCGSGSDTLLPGIASYLIFNLPNIVYCRFLMSCLYYSGLLISRDLTLFFLFQGCLV